MIALFRRRSYRTLYTLASTLAAAAAATSLPACGSDPETPPASAGTANLSAGTGGAIGGSNAAGSTAGGAGMGGATGGSASGSGTTGGNTTGGNTTAGAGSATGGSAGSAAGGSAGSGTSGSGGGSSVTLLVSDDFETGSGTTPDTTKWSVFSADNTNSVAISTEQAHGGTHSIKVDVKNAGAMLTTKVGLPPAGGALYYRAWARFANGAASTATWQPHVTFIEAGGLLGSGEVDQSDEARLGGQAGKIAANLSKGDGLSPDPYKQPCTPCSDPPASDKWVCVEGLIDPTNQKLAAWIDGTQVVKADTTADWHAASMYPAALKRIGFGWESYGSVANTVYYDDVAVSTERINCN
jgi:polysaccharide lyase-like protein